MELRTERLLLRGWRTDDRAPFSALNADPEVMEHFVAPLTSAESDALADRAAAHLAHHGWGLWALEVPGLGFAGFVGLARVPDALPCAPAVEVGWRLARPAWGHGYATEAARAAIAVAFASTEGGGLGLDEVVSFTARTNERSEAVMRRLGMTHDAADDFEHPLLPAGHRLCPHVLLRLTR